ncbi:MAG: hypothetical protein Q7S98_00900 [Deltaproteobacteria bacterium]|nr:hypothetical protein [Deltaproteobacteria bacterium]
MSLKAFHIFFITLSSLLAATLIFWGFRDYQTTHLTGSLVLAGIGILLVVILIPYGRWFLKKMAKVGPLVLGLVMVEKASWACAVCFGDPTSLLSKGAKMGVFFLVAVVLVVLGSIVGVAVSWNRRAKQ